LNIIEMNFKQTKKLSPTPYKINVGFYGFSKVSGFFTVSLILI